MDITITDYYKKEYPKFNKTTITAHTEEIVDRVYCGCDPGSRHFGLTVYINKTLYINQIDFRPGEKNPIKKIANIMEALLFCGIPSHVEPGKAIAVVEGADYGSKFGQVSLSESRTAAMIVLMQLGFEVIKVAPTRVRLLSLGSGKEKGEGYFDFPKDSLASFLCCLTAIKLYDKILQDV